MTVQQVESSVETIQQFFAYAAVTAGMAAIAVSAVALTVISTSPPLPAGVLSERALVVMLIGGSVTLALGVTLAFLAYVSKIRREMAPVPFPKYSIKADVPDLLEELGKAPATQKWVKEKGNNPKVTAKPTYYTQNAPCLEKGGTYYDASKIDTHVVVAKGPKNLDEADRLVAVLWDLKIDALVKLGPENVDFWEPDGSAYVHEESQVSISCASDVLTLKRGGEKRSIPLIKFEEWKQGENFDLSLLSPKIEKFIKTNSTFLVYCNDGQRRSGAFATLYFLEKAKRLEKEVDLDVLISKLQSPPYGRRGFLRGDEQGPCKAQLDLKEYRLVKDFLEANTSHKLS